MASIEFRKVFKSFPGQGIVLRSFELNIPNGAFYSLLGANGAGKTTALRMLVGLTNPDSGSIHIDGVDLSENHDAARQRIAYFPDPPLLYSKLKPLEHLEYVAALWGMKMPIAYRRSIDLMEWSGLHEHKNKLIGNLSKGMKQKLAFIAGVLHDPDILLFDEPFTALDVGSAKMIKNYMKELVANGKTIVLATHIMQIVESFDCRIGILNQGRLIAEGSIDELKECKYGENIEDIFINLTQATA